MPSIAFSHLPIASFPKPLTKVIFQDRQSKCRHFIEALIHFITLDSTYNKLLTMPWDSNDNHKTMWFVELPCKCAYKYSKYNVLPKPFFPELKALAKFVENITGSVETNCVNVNYYEDQIFKSRLS